MNKLVLKLVWLGLLFAVALPVGCKQLGGLLYIMTPPRVQKVSAEFPGLKNHSLAIVIFADEATQYEYPNARLTLAAKIAENLKDNVKNVRVVQPIAVARYQDENIHWDVERKAEIGRDLEVDYVLFVSLVVYSTREPGHLSAYQGRIAGEAKLYETEKKEGENCVWEHEDDLEVTWPRVARYSARVEPVIRQETERRFADMLAKKFYNHKVQLDEEDD